MKHSLWILAILLIAGCKSTSRGPYFDVGVSSFARPDANEKKTYVLSSLDPSISPEDLQFTEFATQVERALAGHGFQRKNEANSADLEVRIEYGIGEPKDQIYYRYVGTPIWLPQTITTFARYVSLVAFDLNEFRKTNKALTVWEMQVMSSGNSGDLRRVFPVMIAAARPYIGRSTGRRVDIRLRENDVSISEIKGISQPTTKK